MHETIVQGNNVVRLRVVEGRQGRKVTVAQRRLPKANWLKAVRKVFKHCLTAMRLKF